MKKRGVNSNKKYRLTVDVLKENGKSELPYFVVDLKKEIAGKKTLHQESRQEAWQSIINEKKIKEEKDVFQVLSQVLKQKLGNLFLRSTKVNFLQVKNIQPKEIVSQEIVSQSARTEIIAKSKIAASPAKSQSLPSKFQSLSLSNKHTIKNITNLLLNSRKILLNFFKGFSNPSKALVELGKVFSNFSNVLINKTKISLISFWYYLTKKQFIVKPIILPKNKVLFCFNKVSLRKKRREYLQDWQLFIKQFLPTKIFLIKFKPVIPKFKLSNLWFKILKFKFNLSNIKFSKPNFNFTKPHFNFSKPHFGFSKLHFIFSKSHFNFSKPHFNFSKPKFIFSHHQLRAAFSFALILILLIMPFKLYAYYKFVSTDVEAKVMRESQAGLTDLMLASEAAAQLDFAKASLRFTKAGENFISAHKELNHISNILLTLASFSGDAKMKLAAESKKILEVGVIVSNLGNNLSATVSNIMSDVKEGKIISAIDTFTFFSQKSLKDLDDLNGLLEKISVNNLPEQYQNKFITLKSKTNVVKKALLEFTDLSEAIKIFLGASQNKRYLLVFQNNNELRASGGFLGSYALIDFKEGNIKNIEIPEGGSYDTEGGLKVLVRSPEPLHLVSPIWYFWDSNWWPDWRLSAQNIMWFYEKSGGSTVDGVISITPTVLERLLEITGPIDLNEQYGVVVSADNFWEIVQGIVEQKGNEVSGYDPKKPKKIIKDLMDKMMLELPKKLNSNNIAKLLLALDKSLLEKDILFYFTDENLQKEISDRNWGGEMQPEDFDYLQVVHTNIAGGKSDRVMKENINQDIEIQSDGSIVKTLTIKREHQGNKQDLYTGVRNVDWLRVYVPEGSKLIEANGFERPNDIYFKSADEATVSNDYVENTENRAIIDSLSGTKSYQENNKTVFANWVMIDPGKTGIVTLKYKLPFSIFEAVKKEKADDWLSKVKEVFSAKGQNVLSYSLLWQKQPGSPESSISSNLKINNGLSVFWQQAGSFHSKDYDWMVKDNLDSDKYWVVLLAK